MNAETTSRYVQVDGRTVHFRHVGRGTPIVLLHPSPRSSAALVPLMDAAPDGVSVHAIDLPGFGRSSPLPTAFASIEAFADALGRTLDRLALPRVRLYGTHTGAAVALVFAVRHPARVERLVLDGLSTFTDAECADLEAYLPALEPDPHGMHLTWTWSRTRDQALFFPWNARRTDARLWRPVPEPAALHAQSMELLLASDYRSAYAAAFRTVARDWVTRLRVPTTVGARANDVLRPHLDRLGPPPDDVRVEVFANDFATWSTRLWALLTEGPSSAVAPAIDDEAWTSGSLIDSHRGRAGARLHWRGRADGAGPPLIVLHDSPGSARCVDALVDDALGTRPVFACDLPGHGESEASSTGDVLALLAALEDGIDALGIEAGDLAGEGVGGWLAHWLVLRRPRRWSMRGAPTARGRVEPPTFAAPRADGGHLAQAWLDARDARILGAWWDRDPLDCVDFGETLDLRSIHRSAVERLCETPQAASLRRGIATLVHAPSPQPFTLPLVPFPS